jgi:histone-lysine N-methyltransferase SETD8
MLNIVNCSIDATSETGRLGRLVNHSRLTPNLQTKVLVFNGTPRLILVARRDIEPGEELLYDYGDRSKESLEAHPWLAL